jgi:hypothetical protein
MKLRFSVLVTIDDYYRPMSDKTACREWEAIKKRIERAAKKAENAELRAELSRAIAQNQQDREATGQG